MRLRLTAFIFVIAATTCLHAQLPVVSSVTLDKSEVEGVATGYVTATVQIIRDPNQADGPIRFGVGSDQTFILLYPPTDCPDFIVGDGFSECVVPKGATSTTFRFRVSPCQAQDTPVNVTVGIDFGSFTGGQQSVPLLVKASHIAIKLSSSTVIGGSKQPVTAVVTVPPAATLPAGTFLDNFVLGLNASGLTVSPGPNFGRGYLFPLGQTAEQFQLLAPVVSRTKVFNLTASSVGNAYCGFFPNGQFLLATAPLTVLTASLNVQASLNNASPETADPANGSVTAHVPLGGYLQIGLVDDNGSAVDSDVMISNVTQENGIESNALFPNNIAIQYGKKINTQTALQGVHRGTAQLTFVPTDTSLQSVDINLAVEDPDQLGSSNLQVDDIVLPIAHAKGILPQYIKGQMEQESGGRFNPRAYRYEPLSPWVGDYGVISRFGTSASPSTGNLRVSSPYDNYRLAELNGDLLAPNGLSRGASVRPEDIAPRVIYQIIDPQTGITRALSPIDQPPDQYVTCEEILLAGNNKAHWSQFNPGNFNFVMNRLAQGDNTPINFTAQTSLAASYGYMQIMYVTAIGTMGWSGVQSGAQNPSYLFDTPANLQIGGGSLELGNSYLRRLFRHEDPADAAKPAFDAQSDLEDVFVAVWGDYNGNKTTYPQSVLGKTRHYPPQSDPANPKPIFTSP